MIVKAEFLRLLDLPALKAQYREWVEEERQVVDAWVKILQELPIDEETRPAESSNSTQE